MRDRFQLSRHVGSRIPSSKDFLLLVLRSHGHALDPESGSVDEVGGCYQVFFGTPKRVSQRCPNWPVLKPCFRCVTAPGVACGHAGDSVQFGV